MSDKATMKQEIFCQEWVDQVGNGTWAAIAAFDLKNKDVLKIPEKERNDDQKQQAEAVMNTASTMAVEYLRKPKIIKRIDEILEERGFNDESVKREHFKLIKHAKDEVKMRAIDSFYKLKGKNAPEKTENTVVLKGFNFQRNGNDHPDNQTTPEAGDSVG